MAAPLKVRLEQSNLACMASHWSSSADFNAETNEITCTSTYRNAHSRPRTSFSYTWKGMYEVDEASSTLIITDVSYEDSKDPNAAKKLPGPFKIAIVAEPLSLKGGLDTFNFDGLTDGGGLF